MAQAATKQESLGILGIESAHWYVKDLERSRAFYVDAMDFADIGGSSKELEQKGKQRSRVFQAGDLVLVVSEPVGEGGRAHRYLQKHPDGVGTLNFRVKDIDRTFQLLEKRGGTFITDVETFTDAKGGTLKQFSIATPFGDSTFRFLQRDGYQPLFPGFEAAAGAKASNKFGIGGIDHVTTNFETMVPAILWMQHVLGLEPFWSIDFHTEEKALAEGFDHGSGLRSQVMWDPESGVKFANNEPYRPFFKKSQINIYHEDNRGNGIQHLALGIKDIIGGVEGLRKTGKVQFQQTPGKYYDELPARIEQLGIKKIDEPHEDLRRLEILIDGAEEHSYLLQIFMKDAASLYGKQEAGPFFYELIQRKGDRGFGGGNFKSLFQSIERDQKAQGRA